MFFFCVAENTTDVADGHGYVGYGVEVVAFASSWIMCEDGQGRTGRHHTRLRSGSTLLVGEFSEIKNCTYPLELNMDDPKEPV